MLPNPWVIIGIAGAWILSLVVCGFLLYARGHDDMRNAYTEQQLAQANANLKATQANQNKSAQAGKDHQANVQIIHDRAATIVKTVQIPADKDPYLPVGFVRLWDRSASQRIDADPYPGKSDGDPSDIRVSEAATLLSRQDGWADRYYQCRKQVIDTVNLNPVLPPPVEEHKGLIEQLNPFD